jgi:hypothetical protein
MADNHVGSPQVTEGRCLRFRPAVLIQVKALTVNIRKVFLDQGRKGRHHMIVQTAGPHPKTAIRPDGAGAMRQAL